MNKLLPVVLALSACGTDTPTSVDSGSPPDGFARLIGGDWSLPPSTQKYLCVRQTVTTDTWVKAIRPESPAGTHHSVLMVGAPDQADGTTECTSALTRPAIYGSGVGTQQLDLPDGVALHIKPGQQLLLNLHLFNAGDSPMTGTSGIDFLPIDPSQVMHEAGVVLAGTQSFTIPDGGVSTQVGTCTTPATGSATVFAVAPHMHLLATHMKITYADAAGANQRVLHDADYSFDDQRYDSLTPALITTPGSKLTVSCTYENHTGHPVSFGERTEDEMCYALTFVYPPPRATTCLR